MSFAQNMDDMIECPYNKAHRMLRKRLQAHLIKCRLSYPDVELQKCPFNQTHLVPEPEFVHHVTNCSDRKLITQYQYDAPAPEHDEERVKQEPVECDDNWDETEVEDYNPQKHLENSNVLRQPVGVKPSQRKMFIKEERKRLGDYNTDDEEEEEEEEEYEEKKHKIKVQKLDNDQPPYEFDGDADYMPRKDEEIYIRAPTNSIYFQGNSGNDNNNYDGNNDSRRESNRGGGKKRSRRRGRKWQKRHQGDCDRNSAENRDNAQRWTSQQYDNFNRDEQLPDRWRFEQMNRERYETGEQINEFGQVEQLYERRRREDRIQMGLEEDSHTNYALDDDPYYNRGDSNRIEQRQRRQEFVPYNVPPQQQFTESTLAPRRYDRPFYQY